MNSQYENLTDEYLAKPDGYYDYSRPEMLPFVPISCTAILDVGCSSGTFGELLKKSRPECEVWGIEPSFEAARVAAERLDKVICGFFEAGMPELSGKLFDCIVFNDVLEHLINPEKVIRDCRQYLSKGGGGCCFDT